MTTTALFDYLVLKPKKFGLSHGAHVELEAGTRIPGEEAESWGIHGRVIDVLVGNGTIAAVPAEEGTAERFYAAYPAEDDAAVEEDVVFPRHAGFGNYELSDGSTVKGKDAALAAEAALDADA